MLQRDFLKARRTSGGSTGGGHKKGTGSRPSSGAPPLSPINHNTISLRSPTAFSRMPSPSLSLTSGALLSQANNQQRPSSTSSRGSPGSMSLGVGDEAVNVAVRCRPPNPAMGERNEDVIVSMDPSKGDVRMSDHDGVWRVDAPVWSCVGSAMDGTPATSQLELYERIGRPLLLHALEGYNSTLMAYGQTGSGKTYTMMGGGRLQSADSFEKSNAGIIPRLCEDLFTEIKARSFTTAAGETLSWEVHVRYVEMYCEKISDLLNSGAAVNVREDVSAQSSAFQLVGARRVKAESADDLLQALALGNKWRKTAATKSNDRSSRSHAIFILELTELVSFEEEDGMVASATSKSLNLRLVDLAGSERVSETGVQGQQLKEAQNINLSLFTLGMVIESLTDARRRGIKPPYRDSVLTKILRDAFGGNSKTTMICNVSPCEASRAQTIQTLNYAAKARHVRNKPRVEEDPSAAELRRANEELLSLRRELNDARRTGRKFDAIEDQLRVANERLRAEQAEAKRRKDAMEKREMQLASRLRSMEEQRVNYESQMSLLEAQAEEARRQQKSQEAAMREAQREAAEQAARRLRELQAQHESMEETYKQKELTVQQQQRQTEEKLREIENKSRSRVDELVRQHRDMESELRDRERQAAAKAEELRQKHELTQAEMEKIEADMRAREEAWMQQVKALEAAAHQREEEVARRTLDANRRLAEAEVEAQRREAEMRRKWSEAETKSRRLQADADAKQADIDRRIVELNREAKQRENEMQDKVNELQYELRRREREMQTHEGEIAALREDALRLSQSFSSKERDLATQQTVQATNLRAREVQLAQREEDLRAQFDDMIKAKQDWETDYRQRVDQLQAEHDKAMREANNRNSELHQRDIEMKETNEVLMDRLRRQDMELKRREVELLAQKNEHEALMQRERQTAVRNREETQHAIERERAEGGLREERLRRWENDLQQRKEEFDALLADREMRLKKRESDIAIAEEANTARAVEQEMLARRLRQEEGELRRRGMQEDHDRKVQFEMSMAQLRRQEMELSQRSRSVSLTFDAQPHQNDDVSTESTKLVMLRSELHRKELYHLFAFEALYRTSLIREEETNFQFMLKERRMEERELRRVAEILSQNEKMLRMRSQVRRDVDAQSAFRAAGTERDQQVQDLQATLEQTLDELRDTKIALGIAHNVANVAEESLQRAREDNENEIEIYKASLTELRKQLRATETRSEEEGRQRTALERGLLFVVTGFEERERHLLEQQYTASFTQLRLDLAADIKATDREKVLDRWQTLCLEQMGNTKNQPATTPTSTPREATEAESRSGQAYVEETARRLSSFNRREQTLRRREERLIADQARHEQRVLDFEDEMRSRQFELSNQEDRVKLYLLELEAMDRQRMREYREREAQLIEQATKLREKENAIGLQLKGAYQSMLMRTADEHSQLQAAQAELQSEGQRRLEALRSEQALLEQLLEQGDNETVRELLEHHLAAIRDEEERLRKRDQRMQRDEAAREKRIAAEEEEIRQYLLFLEQDDIRRSALSQEGQIKLQEAEEKLAKSKRREQGLRDLAHRVQRKAAQLEEASKLLEGQIRQHEKSALEQQRTRKVELDRLKDNADNSIMDNERTLVALEADLMDVVNKNKDAEIAIKSKDAELKRQKLYYLDLSKMLEERDRMLREEHAHRMDGKFSATWLTDDLLYRNDELRKMVKTLRHKFLVLMDDDKIECERCAWKNSRDAQLCRCCGNLNLCEGDPIAVERSL